jgi:Right handed beta helix region
MVRSSPPAMLTVLTATLAVGATLVSATGAASSAPTQPNRIAVGSAAELDAAVRALRPGGGTIVLRPQVYPELRIGWRAGGSLRIVGQRGTRVGRVVFDRASRVTLANVELEPVGRDAIVDVRRSRHIVLDGLVVTARGTRFRSFVRVPDSRGVTIRHGDFSHCGDRSPHFVNCVLLWRWSHDVVIEDSHFHDCRGCDFVHGRFGSGLTIRGNRFERTLPCRGMSKYRCGHQDLVQLFAGRRLTVERNRFGVYREGGAQLYLTNSVDNATVVNNLFVGTDPRVPGYHARMAIIVGSARSTRLPHYAKIVNNTILTGARRIDGYEGSIRMSSKYGGVLRRKRPIVVNNVIAVMEKRRHICSASRLFAHNVVLRGTGCSGSDVVGTANLDPSGHPRRGSTVVDAALAHDAPRTDATGRPRKGRPDIGAFEYRGG